MQQLKRRNKRTEAKIQKEYLAYKKAFGLHIKAIDGTTLRFMFTKISANNPDTECMVDVEDLEGSFRGKLTFSRWWYSMFANYPLQQRDASQCCPSTKNWLTNFNRMERKDSRHSCTTHALDLLNFCLNNPTPTRCTRSERVAFDTCHLPSLDCVQ